MDPRTRRAVDQAMGAAVTEVEPLSGGDINEAYRVGLADRRQIFVKANGRAPTGLFDAEAKGLRWLGEAAAVRLPRVLAVSAEHQPAFIALEFIAPGAPGPDFDERLGRGLAALHRHGAAEHGLDHDNFIGRLAQRNTRTRDFASFYREQRLKPQLALAASAGRLSAQVLAAFERVLSRLEALCGPPEPPARLHGDLWGGNLHVDGQGQPVLIDPAAYAGHREVDLAMMKLFGGFGGRLFDSYQEAYPLQPGAAERVALYQLYPLLVHVNHFGGSYVASLQQTLARVG